MPLPTHQQAMLPVLTRLADGSAHHRRSLADAMAAHFELTPEERSRMLPSGKASVIRSRTGWALAYLKQAGLVQTTRRGWYEREAEDFVGRLGTRIVLIDGRRLVSLMFEHDVGVSARNSYVVKTIDSDYFEEA